MHSHIISAAYAPLLLQPKPDSELADEALYGMSLDILEDKGTWKYVRLEYQYEAWVHETLIAEDADQNWQKKRNALIQSPFAEVLPNPTYKGNPIIRIPRGSLIHCVSEFPDEEGWLEIELLDGTHGFCRKEWIRRFSDFPEKDDSNAIRQAVINDALSYLGTHYKWGGKSPAGIDCSGLTFMAYWMNGISIYRDASIKAGYAVREISKENLQPGDLLYFPGHIALHLENGDYVHSTGSQGGVVLNSLNPEAPRYYKKLDDELYACGSIFAQEN